MSGPITTKIDKEKCVGCGICVSVCPAAALAVVDGKATVTGELSLHCDHCAAACPSGAISVNWVDPDALSLATVEGRDTWLKYGDFDTAALVQLMRSRRSCRSFAADAIARDALEDLVKIGTTAPSGTNSQLWTFTIVSGRTAVEKLVVEVGGFFRKLNALAKNKVARLYSKVFMKDKLGLYYRDYYETVQEAVDDWKNNGRDRLFHGAPALIVIGMKPGASCPCEDALLATQNIILAAHAMGLGTCLIGFAVEAMKRVPSIKQMIGIPARERVYAVIAVGVPKEKYKRLTGRKKVTPRYFEG
ncbi:MAG: 4Fe-4S dicluster domain-containing protein [Deltaproteobacteria bacterium]|nr:4Fe-4S dicluster domain-containing protein [Deltaproteobacteria bacterium]